MHIFYFIGTLILWNAHKSEVIKLDTGMKSVIYYIRKLFPMTIVHVDVHVYVYVQIYPHTCTFVLLLHDYICLELYSSGNLYLYVCGQDMRNFWLWVPARVIYCSTIIGHEGYFTVYVHLYELNLCLCTLEKFLYLESTPKRLPVELGVTR